MFCGTYMHWIVPVGPINIFGGKYHPVISEQAPAEADVFATDRNQAQLAETPWIFVNHTTSSAVDLQHQNEGTTRPTSFNTSSFLSLDDILQLMLKPYFGRSEQATTTPGFTTPPHTPCARLGAGMHTNYAYSFLPL